jgi:chromosome segregation ATPase
MELEKKEPQVKVETLEDRLKEWGIDLEKFRAQADKTKGMVKPGLEREVAALQAKLNEAKKKLEELKKADEAASAELKKGIENGWAELKKAFDSARAKFK